MSFMYLLHRAFVCLLHREFVSVTPCVLCVCYIVGLPVTFTTSPSQYLSLSGPNFLSLGDLYLPKFWAWCVEWVRVALNAEILYDPAVHNKGIIKV